MVCSVLRPHAAVHSHDHRGEGPSLQATVVLAPRTLDLLDLAVASARLRLGVRSLVLHHAATAHLLVDPAPLFHVGVLAHHLIHPVTGVHAIAAVLLVADVLLPAGPALLHALDPLLIGGMVVDGAQVAVARLPGGGGE